MTILKGGRRLAYTKVNVLLAQPVKKQLEDKVVPLSAVDNITPLVLYIAFFFLKVY